MIVSGKPSSRHPVAWLRTNIHAAFPLSGIGETASPGTSRSFLDFNDGFRGRKHEKSIS